MPVGGRPYYGTERMETPRHQIGYWSTSGVSRVGGGLEGFPGSCGDRGLIDFFTDWKD